MLEGINKNQRRIELVVCNEVILRTKLKFIVGK